MNSVFVNPGIYSCAVDAFLEISTCLEISTHFLPYYLSNIQVRNEFTDLLFNVMLDICKAQLNLCETAL